MSGPKSYSPPPRYSMQVFQGKLNEIFKLQCKLQQLLESLDQASCHDVARKIHFDCQAFLRQYAAALHEQVTSFVIQHPGTFGQEVYDAFNKQIQEKIATLTEWLKLATQEQTAFDTLMKDYEAFLIGEKFQTRAWQSFERYKEEVVRYLENYLKKEFPAIFNEARKKIEAIQFTPENPVFKRGFSEELESIQQHFEMEIKKCEQEVNQVRLETANRVLAQLPTPSRVPEPIERMTAPPEMQSKIKEQLEKIKAFIASIAVTHRQQEYEARLNRLLQSATFRNDVYFYTELLDDLVQTEKTIQFKIKIQALLTQLNQLELLPELQNNRLNLTQMGTRLLEQTKVRVREFEDFDAQIVFLKQKLAELKQEAFIREKERLFLKQQIVKSLESLHYVVVDDLQVIDFEERILKVPDQENYIKLRFLPDGTFIYNFLMPEARGDLSVEQKQQKFHEMETTCREFKQLLQDLVKMGLQLKVNVENPASEDGFITMSEKDRNRIKKETKKTARESRVLRKTL